MNWACMETKQKQNRPISKICRNRNGQTSAMNVDKCEEVCPQGSFHTRKSERSIQRNGSSEIVFYRQLSYRLDLSCPAVKKKSRRSGKFPNSAALLNLYGCFQIKSEISYRVIIGNTFYDLFPGSSYLSDILRSLPTADQLTHDPSEVFMSWIGKKTSGVCEHSDKIAQQAQICQRSHLFHHAGLVVIKPPCGPLLDLSNGIAVLEAADDRTDDFIICRVQAVNNRLRQLICIIYRIQEICKLVCRSVVADAVKSGIRT